MSRKPGAKRSKISVTVSRHGRRREPIGTCAYVHNGRRPGRVDARGIGQVRQRGQHHRPLGVPARGDLTLGQCHLRPGPTHVQRGCLRQPRVPPGDLAGQHEVHLGDAGAEPVAPQRLCVPRWQRIAVDVQQRGGRGVVEHHARRRPGHLLAEHAVRRRGPADRRSARRRSTWRPPTGMGQPTVCAERRQHQPRPRRHQRRHLRNRVCGNAGEQRAGVLAAQQAPRRGALLAAAAARRGPRWAGRAGSTACRRGTARARRRGGATSGPSSRRQDVAVVEFGAGARQVAVADRGRPVRQRVGVGDVRHRQLHAAGGAGRTRRRTATPAPAGAPPSRCRAGTPGNSGSGAVRAPPPAVGWASMTCTDRPARAQMTAAARPLGPLPTTVTSTPSPILPPDRSRADRQPIRLSA